MGTVFAHDDPTPWHHVLVQPPKIVYVDKKGAASEYMTARPGHLHTHARVAEARRSVRTVRRLFGLMAVAVVAAVAYHYLIA